MNKYAPLAVLFLLTACNQPQKVTTDDATADTVATTTSNTTTAAEKSEDTNTGFSKEDLDIPKEKEESFVVEESSKDTYIPFCFSFKESKQQYKATCKDTAQFATLVKAPLNYIGIWSTCDVNEDGKTDYLIGVKGTDKECFEEDMRGEMVDRNRRGFILVINKGDHFETDIYNLNCFLSENEDGGVYYAPELTVGADGKKLNVEYSHGRYGLWSYKFNYTNGNYELAECYRDESHGPVTETESQLDISSNTLKIKHLNGDWTAYGEDGPSDSDYTSNTYKVKQLRKVLITDITTLF